MFGEGRERLLGPESLKYDRTPRDNQMKSRFVRCDHFDENFFRFNKFQRPLTRFPYVVSIFVSIFR